jgi:Raf kinase inhibitor-like YbhB/YbcL family protein
MRAWRVCIGGLGIFLAACLGNSVVAQSSNFMSISSPEFAQGQPMPAKTSKQGGNKSPQLLIGGVPLNAKTLVLIVDDPDAPAGLWTHWLLWNIPVSTAVIAEGKAPEGAIQGKNSFGDLGYDGPAPPSGTHRYFFHVSALDTKLSLDSGASRSELETAMKGHVVGSAEFFGTYSANP